MRFAPFLLLMLLLNAVSCNPKHHDVVPTNPPNLRALSADEVTVSSVNNDFAIDLFTEVRGQYADSNIFISPFGVSSTLAILLYPAGDSTKESILNTVKFGSLTNPQIGLAYKSLTDLLTSMDKTVTINFANSLWYPPSDTLTSLLTTTLQFYYGMTVDTLNFADPAAPQTVNKWVNFKTNTNIPTIVTALSANEIALVIDALSFTGVWAKPFDVNQTRPGFFTGEDNSNLQVIMMFVSGAKVHYFHHNNFTLLDLPYGNEQFSMTVLLPDAGASTIQQVAALMSADSINSWIGSASTNLADIRIPRFKAVWKKDLKTNLQDLGARMDGYTNMFLHASPFEIDHVIHESSMDVAESTYDIAETGTSGLTSVGQIEFNHPFIYLIREKHSGLILFVGQLRIPTGG